ncbi:hypothetical protein BU15DRAFT_69106 [Melanogaster broomeanus]|nr:hypothetical protein BU15DRAFT_69106 [Melanogaster broomeanus]
MGLASPVQVPQVPTGPQRDCTSGVFEAREVLLKRERLVRGANGSFAVQVAYFEASGSVTVRVVFLKPRVARPRCERLVRSASGQFEASGSVIARVVFLKRERLVRGANGSFAVQVAYFEASGSVTAPVVFLKHEWLVRGANGSFTVQVAYFEGG